MDDVVMDDVAMDDVVVDDVVMDEVVLGASAVVNALAVGLSVSVDAMSMVFSPRQRFARG
jgi:hypothetical protein